MTTQPPPPGTPEIGPPPGSPSGYPPYGAPPPGYAQPYGYGQPYGYAAPRATNGFAIASLVCGVLWIYWVGSVLALVFGYVARRQIRERNESGDGLALAGIILGWVGVAFLVLAVVVLGGLLTTSVHEVGVTTPGGPVVITAPPQ